MVKMLPLLLRGTFVPSVLFKFEFVLTFLTIYDNNSLA